MSNDLVIDHVFLENCSDVIDKEENGGPCSDSEEIVAYREENHCDSSSVYVSSETKICWLFHEGMKQKYTSIPENDLGLFICSGRQCFPYSMARGLCQRPPPVILHVPKHILFFVTRCFQFPAFIIRFFLRVQNLEFGQLSPRRLHHLNGIVV